MSEEKKNDSIKQASEEAAKEEKDEALEENKTEEPAKEESELEKAQQKADEYLDKYQRTLAEFDNFRKRTSKEKASMYDDGMRDTVEKILPVVDNLQRAVAAQKGKENIDESFFKGVEMISKQLGEILKAMGIEEIPALGEKFDPNLHAAVSHIEDETKGENEITVEMLKGYKHKDKVIRHSMVQVAN